MTELVLMLPIIIGIFLGLHCNDEKILNYPQCDRCGRRKKKIYSFECMSFTPVGGEEISCSGLDLCSKCVCEFFLKDFVENWKDEFKCLN